jgi:hypothetical protein
VSQLKIRWAEFSRALCVFSVVFCMVTDVHNFDFRLLIKEKTNKQRPVERLYNDTFLKGSVRLARPTSRVLWDPILALQGTNGSKM